MPHPAERSLTSALQPDPLFPPPPSPTLPHPPGVDWPQPPLSTVPDPWGQSPHPALWGLSEPCLPSGVRDIWMMGAPEVRQTIQGGEESSCPRKTGSSGVPHHTLPAGMEKTVAELRTVGRVGSAGGRLARGPPDPERSFFCPHSVFPHPAHETAWRALPLRPHVAIETWQPQPGLRPQGCQPSLYPLRFPAAW